MKKNVVAIIPVHGRLPLLRLTIERLLNKNGVDTVVCVGDQPDEEKTCVDAGAKFVYHENQPLGRKWNAGFMEAKKYSPEVCLFVGSSDWLSDNWLSEMLPLMDEYDMVGTPDFTMMDISETIRMCYWEGYGFGPRQSEPIGIGRLISARILDKIGWAPFDPMKNNSMDHAMYQKVEEMGGKIAMVEFPELVALSISTNRWPNMHKFEDHWNDRVPSRSQRIENTSKYFEMFPEYKFIFK